MTAPARPDPAPEHPRAAHRRRHYAEVGFVPVDCLVADILRLAEDVKPTSSRTDLTAGSRGEPEVYTEWSYDSLMAGPISLLHEHRWPALHADARDPYRCEHYALADRRSPRP